MIKEFKSREKKIQKYFTDNVDKKIKVNGKSIYIIETELPLMNAETILSNGLTINFRNNRRAIFGKIDVFLKYKSIYYVSEIKDLQNDSFFYATKSLMYKTYLEWQTDSYRPLKSAVIIPREQLRIEYQLIAGKLDIRIFTFKMENNKIIIETDFYDPPWKL